MRNKLVAALQLPPFPRWTVRLLVTVSLYARFFYQTCICHYPDSGLCCLEVRTGFTTFNIQPVRLKGSNCFHLQWDGITIFNKHLQDGKNPLIRCEILWSSNVIFNSKSKWKCYKIKWPRCINMLWTLVDVGRTCITDVCCWNAFMKWTISHIMALSSALPLKASSRL